MKYQTFVLNAACLVLICTFAAPLAAQPKVPERRDCAAEMTAKGYTGEKLFDETYKCESQGTSPNRAPTTSTRGTIPNDATLKRLQDTVNDNTR
ncbi:hypothetical protein [Rhizobium anhuiense]|uniref:hypothetical protein n=1 Tax=Rhizobium anhuiense TaxID=1184720 RepID=UPI0020CD5477|nr:hypothetical protein [Rhizobium anhuiense]UTS90337.1 hypothetical protein NE851_27610 [Rhizobium anhuiense bv. trifolii]